MKPTARITDVRESVIDHTDGRYYYELDGIILSRDKYNASESELKDGTLPFCILPNKEKFYFNDSSRTLISAIFRNGGKVYGPLRQKTPDVSK